MRFLNWIWLCIFFTLLYGCLSTAYERRDLVDRRITQEKATPLVSGNASYDAGNFKAAYQYYQNYINQTSEEIKNPWVGGRSWIGVPPETLTDFEKQPLNAHLMVFRRMGEISQSKGNYREAVQWNKKGLVFARKIYNSTINDMVGSKAPFHIEARFYIGQYYRSLGLIHASLGNSSLAVASLKGALENDRKIGDKNILSLDYNLGSKILADIGHFEEALIYAEKSLTLYKESPDPSRVKWFGLSYFRIGTIYKQIGKYPQAIENLEQATKVFTAPIYREDLARCYLALSDCYLKVGKYNEALKGYIQAEKIGVSGDFKGLLFDACNGKGIAFSYLELKSEAITAFQKAKAISIQINNPRNQAQIYNSLSYLYKTNGELDQAIVHALAAYDIVRKFGTMNIAGNMLILAELHFLKKDIKTAERYLAEAGELLSKLDRPELQWYFYKLSGMVEIEKGSTDRAIDHFAQAIKFVEDVRSNLTKDTFKTGFVENKIEIYEYMIDALVTSGRFTEAFDYVERAKARTLVDMLAQAGTAIGNREETKLARQEMSLRNQIAHTKSLLDRDIEATSQAADSEIVVIRTRKISALAAQHRKISIASRKADPEFSTLISVNTLSMQEIRHSLEPRSILLSYFVSEDNIHIFTLHKEALKTFSVSVQRSSLIELVRQYRRAITGLKTKEVKRLSTKLHGLLIKPVMHVIAAQDLVILPHGVLHFLPFAALSDGNSYLVERNTISYAPSATVLKYCQEKDRPLQFRILAMGNPDLGDPKYNLPAAEIEVQKIKSIYRDIDIYTRKAANKTNLFRDIGRYDIIHFATHGVYDEAAPMQSCLLLSPTESNDGKLTADNIFSTKLNAVMIVLSACETGLGKLTSGDEVIGLTRSLLFAGASRVVSTLWQINDESTAYFMQVFYGNLNKMPASKALRKAQLKMIRKMPPFYWAPFMLTGTS